MIDVLTYLHSHTEDDTCEHYNINHETIARYRREAKSKGITIDIEQSAVIQRIMAQYSDSELKAIARGGRVMAGMDSVPIVDFSGDRIRIGAISDTHVGSKFTNPDYLYQAFEQFEKDGVDFVTHAGDVTEGMSHRAGHVLECSEIGFHAQRKKAIEMFGQCPFPMYMISGNHDGWFWKTNGANVVVDICEAIGATYLGHDEGNISLKGKATLKLWHGLDGNSYALSYRLQKIIEALTGGEKPHALFAGHCHKCVYIFERHVHTYSMGSIQSQSVWARGKRIAFHTGFWVIDFVVNDSGIAKSTGTWHPFYA